MSWGKKYFTEWTDCNGLDWLVEIEGRDYEGAATEMISTGRPVIFDWLSRSDRFFESPINGSTADIFVYAETDFQYDDLYSVDDLQFRISIYTGEEKTLFWRGFIISGGLAEPYDGPAYPVRISSADGLGSLKNIPYDDDGTPYDGRTRESEIILEILAKIGVTSFTEFDNLYEDNMSDGVEDSPIDQTLIDVDAFRNLDCYSVLERILKKKNAVIRQITSGEIVIYRPTELREETVYGRIFTGSTTKTGISINPRQLLSRQVQTYLADIEGGAKLMKAPFKRVTITQDYGYKESWLDNHRLKAETYKDGAFEGWIPSSSEISKPLGRYLPKETGGAVMQGLDQEDYNKYNKQVFGHNAIASGTDVFVFEFEYLLHNYSISTINNAGIIITVKTPGGEYYLREVNDEYCEWDNSVRRIQRYPITVLQSFQDGSTEWVSFKRKILGLPMDGPYEFYFHPVFSPGTISIRGAVRNVVFNCTSDELVVSKRKKKLKGWEWIKANFWPTGPWPHEKVWGYTDIEEVVERQYIKENVIAGEDVEINDFLGDVTDSGIHNVLEQFSGALAYNSRVNGYRVDRITLTGGGMGYSSADVTCNGVTRQAVYNESLTQTAADFVTDHAAAYLSGGVVVTSSGPDIIFTSNILGAEFTGDTTILQDLGNLDGYVTLAVPAYTFLPLPTATWHTRGGSEGKPLLQIKADEIAALYSVPRQLIQLPVMELSKDPAFDPLMVLQDPLNTRGNYYRAFIFNRGSLDAREREWYMDIFEIGRGVYLGDELPITADRTDITADQTDITADQTHF